MKALKNRTIGFWIGLAGAAVVLVGAIAFAATDLNDRTFSWITFGLVLAGVVCEAANVFTGWRFLPLLCAVLIGGGLSYHLYLGLPTLSDIVNGVNYIGGDPNAVIIFGALFLVGTLAAVCACFMEQSKPVVSIEH